MGKVLKFGWSRAEVGAVAVEATIALPLFLTVLFMFQDLLVVGYNFIGIRHSLEEGIRVAAMGPECRDDGFVYCPEPTLTGHLSSARDHIRSVATNIGVWDEWGFMNNETTLYDGQLDIVTLAEEDVMSSNPADDTACRTGPVDYSEPPTEKFCRVHIKLSKSIQLTPPSGLILTLAGGDGRVTITREDWAAVER